jgi:hypothetical protein
MDGMTETPDCWKFVKVVPHDSTIPSHNRVLCSWYGGYLGGDCWRLSSGNKEVIDRGDYLEVPQHSGTLYRLYKNREKMSGYMQNIFDGTNRKAVDYSLEIVDRV